MKQLLIVMSLLVPQVYPLQCLQCKSRSNNCHGSLQTCGVKDDACITLTYDLQIDVTINTTRIIRFYHKECVQAGSSCEQNHCAFYKDSHYRRCTALCCFGNECNRYLDPRTRRNFSGSRIVHCDWLVFLFTLILSTERLLAT